MRFETCDQLIEDYIFYVDVINNLDEEWFELLSEDEIIEKKRDLIDECRRDFSFKILTKIEAEIRLDVQKTLSSRRRDPISRILYELARKRASHHTYQKQVSEEGIRLRLEDVLLAVRDFFKGEGHDFHHICSQLKGHLSFRDWYAHGRYFKHYSHFSDAEKPPDPYALRDIYDELTKYFLKRAS